MAWESRRNRRYHYRSHRVDGRIVKEYFGAGLAGKVAADEDATRRQRQQRGVAARLAEQQREAELLEAFEELDATTDTLARAVLATAGYHQHHRGEWRRRRA
jgi:hypothetical protein